MSPNERQTGGERCLGDELREGGDKGRLVGGLSSLSGWREEKERKASQLEVGRVAKVDRRKRGSPWRDVLKL